jgi:hypothetical protein
MAMKAGSLKHRTQWIRPFGIDASSLDESFVGREPEVRPML